ncbi:MAG: tRNA guanosine(34) transglycosylase Tgt [Patescibacteria group bacterium]
MKEPVFKIIKNDPKTQARLGVLITPHGKIETPSYVIVATHAQIKCLKPSDIKKTKTQLVISNTFHLWSKITKHKSQNTNKTRKHKIQTFLLNKLGTKIPTMTDSGGFQVLSLAFGDKNKVGKFMTGETKADKSYKRSQIRITQKGVYFKFNGKKLFLGPELSMKLQAKIGADITFAFDHITSPLDTYNYNKKAVELTNKWAKESLKFKFKNEKLLKNKQLLFGIVQGGLYKNLRIKSAKSIGSMPFDGFGIGGSYTKKQILKILKWVVPFLPNDKPRHLLGVGKIADIFEAVENGVDLFDCVIPTREARHGRIYSKKGYFDISKFQNSNTALDKGCGCLTCKTGITRQKLSKLFKSGEKEKQKARRLATIHNVWFFNNLLAHIRSSIQKSRFLEFKKKFLKSFTT